MPKNINKASYIESFYGILDRIDGDIAHVTLTDLGENVVGQYSAKKMLDCGVRENRKFKLHVTVNGSSATIDIQAIPDVELSEEKQREIHDKIVAAFGDDDSTQDDY